MNGQSPFPNCQRPERVRSILRPTESDKIKPRPNHSQRDSRHKQSIDGVGGHLSRTCPPTDNPIGRPNRQSQNQPVIVNMYGTNRKTGVHLGSGPLTNPTKSFCISCLAKSECPTPRLPLVSKACVASRPNHSKIHSGPPG